MLVTSSSINRSWVLLKSALCLATTLAGIGLAGAGRADPLRSDWEHDWVAVTVAQNGTWGVATHQNLTRAMIQAIRECSRKSGPMGNDCGAEITTVRAAWSLAYACGDYTFIANGDTSADARTAAIHRAIDLRDILGTELPPCTLLVAVGSDGHIEPTRDRTETLAIPKPGR